MNERQRKEAGYALVTVMILSALIAAMLSAHFMLTRADLSTTSSTMSSTRSFYAAEAGVNIRAEVLRSTFLGYTVPSGTRPAPLPGQLPCVSGTPGTGDLACITYSFPGRDVVTYVDDDIDNDETPDGPVTIVIPPDEEFQNLSAQEYRYETHSVALGREGFPEAILEMRLRSRLVPMFQFAAFYDKDLEILPGPAMTLQGPVHTNGNLFLDAGASLTIDGQVTTADGLFHGRKNNDDCADNPVSVHDLSGPLAFEGCSGGTRDELTQADIDGTNPPNNDWEGMIKVGATEVDVPSPSALDPVPGSTYWDLADLRIMRDLNDATDPVKVYNPDGTVDFTNTADLKASCPTAAGTTSVELYNHRETAWIDTLEIDVQELMDCIELNVPNLMGGAGLDDATHSGLVWYFGVDDGVNAAAPNTYGVRVKNGAMLGPSSGAVDINGLTVVTNQAIYIEGNYNQDDGVDWRPAALLADSLNVLSNAWDDTNSDQSLGSRLASSTTIRAGFLAGTDTTGGPAGEGTLSPGNYNGGLENYPRFHEDWGGTTLTYRGSFVSLNRPLRVDGLHSTQSYSPPSRDWGFELRFNDPANLPPLSPRFVYLKLDLFEREFDY